ncbi:MAG: ribonuclease III [Firmicutes bacterium]|nr:ribonuclease III [Bacillota bacterium]
MTEKAAVTTIDTSMMDGAALAFIGDAVYEIYVRKHVLAEAGSGHQSMALKVDALHHGTVQFVNAEAQAFAIKAMADDLTEEEQAVVRRARNHKPHSVPKHADVMDYKWATAFEALVGYLYLTGETEEMEKVIRRAITVIEEQR